MQGPVYLDRSDNIFNIKVNGALAMHIIVHNLQTQNRNRLKFGISDSYMDIYLLMTQKNDKNQGIDH